MNLGRKEVFNLKSDSAALKPLREQLRALLAGAGFDDKTVESLLIAICEAFTNAIRHSYHNEPGRDIQVTFEEAPDQITLRVRDYGTKIKVQEIKEPTLPPVKGGGLGIYFMKTIMDSLEYNTAHPEGNELIMVKRKGAPKS